jgi:lysophospholipase L1-like esterase
VLLALAGACALQACSQSQTQPSPPPPPVPDPPKISCPAPISVLSPLATPISIVYGTPTSVAGAPPVVIACTPESTTVFPLGPTTVTCTATDAQQRKDSCTFTVTVTAPPKISATKYVAFGDSMTAGEIVSESGVNRTLRVDPAKSYPADLQTNLVNLYTTQAQSISVENQGRSGEAAVDGVSRLRGILSRGGYDVLTLMDGANDLADRDSRTANLALDAVRSMVRDAKSRGVLVYLATLPPQNPAGCCPDRGLSASLVEPYNDGIRGIANSEAVTLVDVYQAFNGDITTLVDVDGLHPTAAGYQKIADTFFKAIRQDLEQAAAASMFHPFRQIPRFVPPGRR